MYNSPLTTRLNVRKWHAYVQDQFVIADRVTLNLGLRADHATGNLEATTLGGGRWDPLQQIPEQTGVVDITNVAPRFGVVWDVTGDHKNTFKASAGRFYDSIAGSDIESVSPAVLGTDSTIGSISMATWFISRARRRCCGLTTVRTRRSCRGSIRT